MKHKLNTSQSLEYLEKMLVIRQFEEACAALYMKRKIGGFLHLYIGQEAVAVGAESVLASEIDFKIDNPVSPVSLLESPDSRSLGILVESIKIN